MRHAPRPSEGAMNRIAPVFYVTEDTHAIVVPAA
jgi:hypothetical protein